MTLALFSAFALADGATDFATFCSSCHGAGGAGDGVAAVALDPKPADFTAATFWDETRTDEYLAGVIKNGGASVGKSPMMAPWGGSHSDEQIAAIVGHPKTLNKG